jgi:hypothetical protein
MLGPVYRAVAPDLLRLEIAPVLRKKAANGARENLAIHVRDYRP